MVLHGLLEDLPPLDSGRRQGFQGSGLTLLGHFAVDCSNRKSCSVASASSKQCFAEAEV